MEIKVKDELKAKSDGRKTAWWIKKIAALETELASRNGHGTYNEGYAEGFKDAMHRFQIRNKTFRSRIYERILANGPGEVKRIRGSMF